MTESDYASIYFPEFHRVDAVTAVRSGAEAFGWLAKQGGRIAQASKRRWFVLVRARAALYYYKTQKDAEPSGFVPLEDCAVARDAKRPLALVLALANSSRHLLHVNDTRVNVTLTGSAGGAVNRTVGAVVADARSVRRLRERLAKLAAALGGGGGGSEERGGAVDGGGADDGARGAADDDAHARIRARVKQSMGEARLLSEQRAQRRRLEQELDAKQ